MSKGYAAAVLTAVGLDEQRRYFAVDIGYTTPLRITNCDHLIVVATNTHYPWSMDVLEPSVDAAGSQDVILVMSNGDLTGVGALTGRVAELDVAQDSRGKTLKVYECTTTAAGRTDTLVFDGLVDEFSAADDSGTCRITGTPQETMGSRPGSNYCMSICRWRKYKGDDCQYAGTATSCSRTIVDCRKKVGAETFAGSGLDDMTAAGTHSGTEVVYYRIQIDATGTPDTFSWSNTGDTSWDATGVAITGAAQTLENGVTVTFAATTGHTDTNYWTFQASWEDRFGNLLHAPAAGTVIELNGTNVQVQQSHGGYYQMPIVTPPPDDGGGLHNTPMVDPRGTAAQAS